MAKKVLIIRLARPSYELTVVPPLGPMYLASALRTWGRHKVTIYDMKVEGDSIAKATRKAIEFEPDVIGLSLMSYETPVMPTLAASLKKALPHAFMVAGGAHPSTFPQDIATETDIDMFVLGEGEVTFNTLLERIENDGQLDDIEGTAIRIDGQAKINPRTTFIQDLDTLPMPAWDLIPIEKYFDLPRMGNIFMHREFMPIFTSRCCPYKCVYCHDIFGKVFRPRSPENVMEEIKLLYTKYSIREIMIMDDCFNIKKTRAHEILSSIASSDLDISLRFPNGIRADILDWDMVVAFKEAHTFTTCVAVETAVPRLQKLLKKNLNLEKVFGAINMLDKLKIMTHGFFMIGIPTETRQDMMATIDYAMRSRLHTAAITRTTPFKGTELYQMALKMGYSVPDNPDSFQYYNTHVNLSAEPNEEVTKMQNLFYRRFYLSPFHLSRFIRLMPNKRQTLPRLLKIFFSRAFN